MQFRIIAINENEANFRRYAELSAQVRSVIAGLREDLAVAPERVRDKELLDTYESYVTQLTADQLPDNTIVILSHLTALQRISDLIGDLATNSVEEQVLHDLDITYASRGRIYALLGLFHLVSANEREAYYNSRNTHLGKAAKALTRMALQTKEDNYNSRENFRLYQSAERRLKITNTYGVYYRLDCVLSWLSIKMKHYLRIQNPDQKINQMFHDPEGRSYINITSDNGILTEQRLSRLTLPPNGNLLSHQSIYALLMERQIISTNGRILMDVFTDDAEQQLRNTLGASADEIDLAQLLALLRGAYRMEVSIESQENLCLAFTPKGRYLAFGERQDPYRSFHNELQLTREHPAINREFHPEDIELELIRRELPGFSERNASKFGLGLGLVSRFSFVTMNKDHFLGDLTTISDRLGKWLNSQFFTENESKITEPESEAIFFALNESHILENIGRFFSQGSSFRQTMSEIPLLGRMFWTTERQQLDALLREIMIPTNTNNEDFSHDRPLSLIQRNEVARILRFAYEHHLSPADRISVVKVKQLLKDRKDMTYFAVTKGDTHSIVAAYNNKRNPYFKQVEIKHFTNWEEAFRRLPSLFGLRNGLYKAVAGDFEFMISRGLTIEQYARLFRKLTSHQYLLLSLAVFTTMAVVFRDHPFFQATMVGSFNAGTLAYGVLKGSRALASGLIVHDDKINGEYRFSSQKNEWTILSVIAYFAANLTPPDTYFHLTEDVYLDIAKTFLAIDIGIVLRKWALNSGRIWKNTEFFRWYQYAFFAALSGIILADHYVRDASGAMNVPPIFSNQYAGMMFRVSSMMRRYMQHRRFNHEGTSYLDERKENIVN